MTAEPIAARIADAFDTLAPQEQRVAEFLRTHPRESALYNSAELARLTGVSKATVSRLYRRLGFADSREARELLRAQRGAGLPVVVDAPGDRLAVQLARDTENLRDCLSAIDPALLEEAAQAIAGASRVLVLGFRSAFPVALHLRAQLAQVRAAVTLAPEPGQSIGEELVGLGAADVVIVVGLRRRPELFRAVLDALVRGPARVLLIADPSLAGAVGAGADWRIDAPIESASPFDSFAAVSAVVSVLAGAVLDAAPRGAARVAEIGAAYAVLSEVE